MKPIGRIYVNETCISGYIIIGGACIKFAAPIDENEIENSDNKKSAFVYLAKSQR